MKAANVEKPGVLRVRDVPRPVPGECEALCELLYGATQTGLRLNPRHGLYRFANEPAG